MGLFDHRKEKKTIILAKKLQEEADKEWEKEQNKRKEQELNDEAIAKALQAQLEQEDQPSSNTSIHTSPVSSSPPPLPVKPKAYNSSNNVNRQSFSSISLPTISTTTSKPPPTTSTTPLSRPPPSVTPLYSLSSTSGTENKRKSYVSSQSYRPELKFNLSTPGPSHSSVFNETTPKITPTKLPPQDDIRHHDFYGQGNNNSAAPIVMKPVHDSSFQGRMSMPEPISTSTANYSSPMTPPPFTPHKSDPPPVIPVVAPNNNYSNSYPNSYQNKNSSYPANNNSGYGYQNNGYTPVNENVYPANVSIPLNTNNIVQNATYSQQKPPISTTTSSSGLQLPPMPVFNSSTSISPPFVQSNTSTPPPFVQNNNSTPPPFVQSNSTAPFTSPFVPVNNVIPPPFVQSTQSSFVSSTNTPPTPFVSNNNTPFVQSNNVTSTPFVQKSSTVKSTTSTNPYNNMKYSSSSFSFKPDEDDTPQTEKEDDDDDDDWDIVKTTAYRPPTPIANTKEDSDDDSAYDYSDMVYSRKDSTKHVQEEEEEEDDEDWQDQAIDPFADNFSVQVPSTSNATSATIIGEIKTPPPIIEELPKKTNVLTTLQPSIEILDPTLAAITIRDEKTAEEKQIDATVIRQYEEKESNEIEARPFATPQFQPSYQTRPLVELELPDNEQMKVYPTNVVKAGAPPKMSKSNPYNKSSSSLKPVPATDYGYFKDEDNNKQLPELPPATSDEDRHITVASINPGQKVWIRVQPTDTGKSLAERIGIVASYRTRRVTKITSRNGRVIPLDNTPLFDDWNMILKFQEGELWKIEWEPIDHTPYVDIITEGKEFMKQLKANFKSSS